MKFWYTLLLTWLLAALAFAQAQANEPPTNGERAFKIQGFGTLGIARSDNEEVQYIRDLSQPDGLTEDWSGKIDSVLGLQASYRFSEEAEGVLQAISRYRYDGSYDPEISWAFLRFEPEPGFSLRAGRLGTEFFMLADSRLVGYSNLTVRPPPDFFHNLIFSYFDGVDVSATRPAAAGLLRGKLFAGLSPETSPFIKPLEWDMSGSLMLGGHLDYLSGPWQIRLAHARIRFERDPPLDTLVLAETGAPGYLSVVPEMSAADKWSGFSSLGLVYDEGPLQLQAMWSRIDHETASYEDVQAAYAIAAYRFGPLSPYLGYSWTKTSPDRIAPTNTPYDAITASLFPQTHGDQHTWFLGARWDFQPNMALKAQVDRIDANPCSISPFRDGTSSACWSGEMTVYSLALDFVF